MEKMMIYKLDPLARYLSEEEKKRLREAQVHGYGVFMPGQWAQRLMNEIDDLQAINEELRRKEALSERNLDVPEQAVPEEGDMLPIPGDSQ